VTKPTWGGRSQKNLKCQFPKIEITSDIHKKTTDNLITLQNSCSQTCIYYRFITFLIHVLLIFNIINSKGRGLGVQGGWVAKKAGRGLGSIEHVFNTAKEAQVGGGGVQDRARGSTWRRTCVRCRIGGWSRRCRCQPPHCLCLVDVIGVVSFVVIPCPPLKLSPSPSSLSRDVACRRWLGKVGGGFWTQGGRSGGVRLHGLALGRDVACRQWLGMVGEVGVVCWGGGLTWLALCVSASARVCVARWRGGGLARQVVVLVGLGCMGSHWAVTWHVEGG